MATELSFAQDAAQEAQTVYAEPTEPRHNFGAASLYVGDLHPSITEQVLSEKFSTIGPIVSVRIIANRDQDGPQHNYGYVNFEKREDAEKAMTTHKFASINGSPCRIMWSQRDSSLRSSVLANVFVRGLTPTTDNQRLQAAFAQFGAVISCKVVYDDVGVSKGYGFVQFEKENDAKDLLSRTKTVDIDGVSVDISKFISRNQPRETSADLTTNVFVKNIPERFDQEDLRRLFSVYGAVTSCVVMKDPNTGISRRFGFVNFANTGDADKAIVELDGSRIEGIKLIVNRAQSKRAPSGNGYQRQSFESPALSDLTSPPRRGPVVNVFVKHLDVDITESALCDAFQSFGTIVTAKIVREASGESKGFGFLVFSHPDEATAAVSGMNGKRLGSRTIYVALSHHNERRSPRHYGNEWGYGPGQMYGLAPFVPAGMVPPGYGYMGYPPYQPDYWGQGSLYPNYGMMPPAYPSAADVAYAVPEFQKLTPEMIASLPEGNQKQVIGDFIYTQVMGLFGQAPYLGKITGIMLELPMPEILVLIQDFQALQAAATEALKRLEATNSVA